MKQMENIAKYAKIPFKDGGRSIDSVDCWGMIYLVYKEELGIILPTYGDVPARDLINVVRNISKGADGDSWRPIDEKDAQPYDVCVMSFMGHRFPGHVGLVTRNHPLFILHTETGVNAAIVSNTHYTIRERIVGYRRHVDYAR